MKIMLFGGGGFIGEYLASRLRERSDCLVKVVGRCDPVTEDADLVVILTQPNGPLRDILLPALSSMRKLKKIIYCSTILLYPDSLKKQDETTSPSPLTEYELAKYREELSLSDFVSKKDISLCLARIANVYGDVKNRGIVSHILSASITGSSVTVFGNKDEKIRDYILVDDVARLLEFLIFYGQKSREETFNLCTGRGSSVHDILCAVELLAGNKITVLEGASVLEKRSVIGQNEKIVALSGFRPQYMMAGGLERAFGRYKEFYAPQHAR